MLTKQCNNTLETLNSFFITEVNYFAVKRFFLISNVPSKISRGNHAHKVCKQYLMRIYGEITIAIDDGLGNRKTIVLNESNNQIFIPEMVWLHKITFSSDAIIAVLASDFFSEEDYIRNYDEFLHLKKGSI